MFLGGNLYLLKIIMLLKKNIIFNFRGCMSALGAKYKLNQKIYSRILQTFRHFYFSLHPLKSITGEGGIISTNNKFF